MARDSNLSTWRRSPSSARARTPQGSAAASSLRPDVQPALLHGPGDFSAVTVWRARGAPDREAIVRRAAQLMSEAPLDDGPHTLVALRPSLVPAIASIRVPEILPRQSAVGRFPSTQADALVQIAAPDRATLLVRLRRCATLFAGVLASDEEILGGRIGDGREAFGLRDGRNAPTLDDLTRVAIVPSGPLRGCAWVLYLRIEQDLERFARLRPAAQSAVIGADARAAATSPNEDAHVRVSRRAKRHGDAGMIRRGFPYRAGGAEGLAFVAASSDPARFAASLDAMLGCDGGPPDALLRYVAAVGGGLYLAPPAGAWLRAGGEAAP